MLAKEPLGTYFPYLNNQPDGTFLVLNFQRKLPTWIAAKMENYCGQKQLCLWPSKQWSKVRISGLSRTAVGSTSFCDRSWPEIPTPWDSTLHLLRVQRHLPSVFPWIPEIFTGMYLVHLEVCVFVSVNVQTHDECCSLNGLSTWDL